MIQIASISLENEMDLILAHRKSMKIAEKLGLTVATQTTFATAVSEIARTIIDHTNNGNLLLGVEQNKQRYSLKAVVTFDSSIKFTNDDEGFYYAQKLVPEFDLSEKDGMSQIEMKLGVPRSAKLDRVVIETLVEYFETAPPISPYEEIKRRNRTLNKIAWEQEEELRQSKIIDEKKNEFISIASHEIKTPITIIKAYTQMLKAAKEPVSERVKGILDKLDSQSGKLLALVQQLLDVSKIEHGNLVYAMDTIEINPFISEMADVMKNIIPDHEMVIVLGDNINVHIDRLRMEQVFSNLLGNAAKYSKKKSVITLQSAVENGLVTISVKDEGIGLSADSIKSVFNKFYRDKDVLKTHTGLGMGLYIASKIVNDHGGKIWVESTEGNGSTFHFTIPCQR